MFESTDKALFSRIIRHDKHVLQHYLPERYKVQYNLRPWQHGHSLILHRPHRPTGHTGAGGRDLILHRQPVMYQMTLFTRHYYVIMQ